MAAPGSALGILLVVLRGPGGIPGNHTWVCQRLAQALLLWLQDRKAYDGGVFPATLKAVSGSQGC